MEKGRGGEEEGGERTDRQMDGERDDRYIDNRGERQR